MTCRKPSSAFWISGIVLAALVFGYVGMYCWLVAPVRFKKWPDATSETEILPSYRGIALARAWGLPCVGNPGPVPTLFTPMLWLDRRMRPHIWNP